jgi:hypothetical protein
MLSGPARYRVTIDDRDAPEPMAVWAMSPGEALDTAMIYVDATEKVNVRGSPAHVEEIAREPDPDDLKSTDEGWPFAPPPRPPRFDRQDIADSLIFIAIMGIAGAVLCAYAFALFSLLEGEWIRGLVAAVVATVPGAGVAALWLKA